MERGRVMGKIISGAIGLVGILGIVICYIGLALFNFVSIAVGGTVMAIGFTITAIFVVIAAIVFVKGFIADIKEWKENKNSEQTDSDC